MIVELHPALRAAAGEDVIDLADVEAGRGCELLDRDGAPPVEEQTESRGSQRRHLRRSLVLAYLVEGCRSLGGGGTCVAAARQSFGGRGFTLVVGR
ncbi:MAG: hypothetical protein ACE5KX_02720 [Acidimicrobiia bacterium]